MTYRIAFCSNQSPPYYNKVLQGVIDAVNEADNVELIEINNCQRLPFKALQHIHPDGILTGAVSTADFQAYFPDVPVIGFSNALKFSPFPAVINDDSAVARHALKALIHAGYQRILILECGANRYVTRRADVAEADALARGISVERIDLTLPNAHQGHVFHDIWAEHIQALRSRIASLAAGTGILAVEPRMANEVLELIEEGETLQTPDQLGLILADLPEPCNSIRPAHVQLAAHTIGAHALNLLLQKLEHSNFHIPEITVFPPKGINPGDTLLTHARKESA